MVKKAVQKGRYTYCAYLEAIVECGVRNVECGICHPSEAGDLHTFSVPVVLTADVLPAF
jgi:hypothetical protein